MRLLAFALVALTLAGCAAVGPLPASTTPATPTTPHGPDPDTPASIVAIDGRWAFDEAAGRAIVGGNRTGAIILGEARLDVADASAAGPVVALDADALALLGGGVAALPAHGEVLLSENASAHLGAHVGDEIALVAYRWPASTIVPAFEMERVRPCDAQTAVALCVLPGEPDGTTLLKLHVPARSSDLAFHPDIVELTPRDFPAQWSGTLRSPAGVVTPFETGARSRADVSPPARLDGPTMAGDWIVAFDLSANHTRIPGAVAGLITYRTQGYTSFDVDLLHLQRSSDQTRALLANATRAEVALRVAGTYPQGGAGGFLHAAALVSMDDARALFDVPAGNVTALVAATRAGLADEVVGGASASNDPDVRALSTRAARPAPALDRAGTLYAPPDLDAASLGGRVALTVEGAEPLGGAVRLANATVAARLLAMPADDASVPWSLVPRALWPNASAALAAIATGPHLALVGEDVARAASLDPGNLTYSKLEIESAVGPRTVFTMGAVRGGPPDAAWVSASLLSSAGRALGARIVVSGDAEALARGWRDLGVAALVEG